MNDARTVHPDDRAELSIQSARKAALRSLARQAINGLTLDEYVQRAGAVEHAATVDELEAALQGLPEEPADASPGRRARWIVAVLGGTDQRGRWRLSGRLRIVAVLAGVNVDLGQAEPEAPESAITVVAAFGGAGIIVPQGVPVQLSGFSLLGGKGDKRTGGSPLPGSPLIRVRAFALFGGVTIKDRPRKLRELARRRHRTPRGG